MPLCKGPAAGGLALAPLRRERAASAHLEEPILLLDVSLAVYHAGSHYIRCFCGKRVAPAAAGLEPATGVGRKGGTLCTAGDARPSGSGSRYKRGEGEVGTVPAPARPPTPARVQRTWVQLLSARLGMAKNLLR